MKRDGWITWLTVALAMVLLYSLLLVVAGGVAGSLFDLLGFGPPASIDSPDVREYLRLPCMVLGAVMAGWSLLMLLIVRGPLKEGASWAPRFLLLALALWFVLDTGMSLVLGFPTHALFNIPFALALGIPLLALRRATRA